MSSSVENPVGIEPATIEGSAIALFLEELRESRPIDESIEMLFERVERAKQEWEATVDALRELICLVDDQGRILRANRTVEMWNLSAVTDVRGRDLHELIHPDCISPFCYLNRLARRTLDRASERDSVEFEIYDPILRRHLLVRTQPMPKHKRVAWNATAVVMLDISDRKRAEDAVRRHTEHLRVLNEIGEAILAACSPDTIAHVSLSRLRKLIPFRQARVTLVQPDSGQWRVLAADVNGETHLKPGQLLPADAFSGNQERWPGRHFVIQDLATLSDLTPIEQQLAHEGVHAYISIPMFAQDEFIGALSLASDRPAAFDQEHVGVAYQVADLLAIAIRQTRLYENLSRANTELHAALQAKEQMSQNVSHDLRCPLSVISGYIDLLAGAELGPLTGQQAEAIRIVRQQADHMLSMITQLLTLQTIEAKTLRKEPIELADWLRQVVQPWEVRMAQSGIRLGLEIPADKMWSLVDAQLLAQVVENLLDNAIKFSPAGGVVKVHLRAIDAQKAVIAVADEGAGISASKLRQIFQRFYQAEEQAAQHSMGKGIGLALCQAVVEAHEGEIWAESRGEGQGSTFLFTLPIAGAAPER